VCRPSELLHTAASLHAKLPTIRQRIILLLALSKLLLCLLNAQPKDSSAKKLTLKVVRLHSPQ
jgi:hypothetical protein